MFLNPFVLADKVLVGTEKLDGTQIFAMTVIGLLVVFSALLILVIFLNVSGSIFRKADQTKKSAPAPKKAAPAKSAPAKPAPAKAAPAKPAAKPAASDEDEEVIAVIMAAISAMSEADGKQYQIRSVKQVTRNSGRAAWAQAGRISATQPF